jgi:tRNA 2-thiouridine synthesizing protein E
MMPARDKEGYLQDLGDWDEAVAAMLAEEEGIILTAEHWELIQLIRRFYDSYEVAPAMRVLVKQVRRELGAEKGSSLHLLRLFPGSPARILAKIAGLPRPTNCL